MSEPSTPVFPEDRSGDRSAGDRYGDRYGTRGRPQGSTNAGLSARARVAIGAALAVAVALAAWLALEQTRRDPVTFDVVAFTVVDPEQVDVTFQVHMPPGTTAVCTVNALAQSYAQVGTVDVTVGPSQDRTTQQAVTVRTSEEATTAVVDRCVATER